MKRLRHLRGEAGASSVELLVFFPLLLLIILLAVQTGLSWYGNEVAMTAARETARTLRTGAHDDAALDAHDGVFGDFEVNGEVVEVDDAPHQTAVGHDFVAFFQAANEQLVFFHFFLLRADHEEPHRAEQHDLLAWREHRRYILPRKRDAEHGTVLERHLPISEARRRRLQNLVCAAAQLLCDVLRELLPAEAKILEYFVHI